MVSLLTALLCFSFLCLSFGNYGLNPHLRELKSRENPPAEEKMKCLPCRRRCIIFQLPFPTLNGAYWWVTSFLSDFVLYRKLQAFHVYHNIFYFHFCIIKLRKLVFYRPMGKMVFWFVLTLKIYCTKPTLILLSQIFQLLWMIKF